MTGEVIDLFSKRKEIQMKEQEKNDCKCPACGHEVETVEDWSMAAGLESGIHVCPKCESLLDSSIFDDMAKVEMKPIPMLVVNIPIEYLADVSESLDEVGFNAGQAILNSRGVRESLVALTSPVHAKHFMETKGGNFKMVLERAEKLRKEISKNG